MTLEQARALLDIFVPAISKEVTDEQLAALLVLAESHRPGCLDEARGDEAVIFYLIHLLLLARATDPASSGSTRTVLSEKVGDEQITYASEDKSGAGSNPLSPDYWLAKWGALNDICVRAGSITVSGNRGGGCCKRLGGA